MQKIINYFKESWEEIQKVTWPTKQETINYTLVVISISIATAAFLGGLDYLLALGLQKALELK